MGISAIFALPAPLHSPIAPLRAPSGHPGPDPICGFSHVEVRIRVSDKWDARKPDGTARATGETDAQNPNPVSGAPIDPALLRANALRHGPGVPFGQEAAMPQRLTRQEFVAWAETQPRRYERIDGEPVAMPRQPAAHVRIKSRIWAALDRVIQRAGLDSEALADGMTVEIDADTDYEPDALVNCGPNVPPEATVASNPVIVVEVLSPSTQSIDSNAKLADYFRVPSIQHYLILQTRKREVIHYTRSGTEIIARVLHLGTIALHPPGIEFDLTEVYGPDTANPLTDSPLPPHSGQPSTGGTRP